MRHVPFKQVDVFTGHPFFGNPVAVVLDGAGLDAAVMQRIAAWTNLSETTFVLPSSTAEADYRVRIFTPRKELPFAGHPTIGTAHAVLEAGLAAPREGQLHQECAAGLLRLSVDREGPDRHIAVEAPQATLVPIDEDASGRVTAALGCVRSGAAPQTIVHIGPRWLVVELCDAAAVRTLTPDLTAVADVSGALGVTGITVFGRASPADHAIATRSFAPAGGIPEDPVCGSGNAAVGALLHHVGALPAQEYVASQGREMNRDGYVTVRADPTTGRTWIGGQAVTCVEGTLRVE
jgi:PhzF family phenazine biosynthesis protein